MEKNEHIARSSFQRRGNQQLLMPTQLLQASARMTHIDEMLSWLASVIVQQLNVQLIQFWTTQAFSNGQMSVVLRANVCEDTSLPQSVIYNAHVVEVVGNLLRLRQGFPLQSVNTVFSIHQTNLFLRYGLNYSFGHFLSSSALLPPKQTSPSTVEVATPFTTIALLFVRRIPSRDLPETTNRALEQAIAIAKLRGLLVASTAQGDSGSMRALYLQQQESLSLAELIPHRLQATEALRSQNPFASTAITEKNASRFYQAIDGQKTVLEIASLTRLREEELIAALRTLLKRELIQLRDPTGQPVDGSKYLDHP